MKLKTSEDGFTLMELMVALLIIAILIGIALPTWVGNRNQAADTRTKTELRASLPAMGTLQLEGDDLSDIDTSVSKITPTIVIDGSAVNGIKFLASSDGAICAYRVSETEKVFGLWAPASGEDIGTLYGEWTALPAGCPDRANAPIIGFTANPW